MAPSPLCAPASPSFPSTASAAPQGRQPPETRQTQMLCAGSFPLTPSAALHCTLCRSWCLVSPHSCHVFYPSQLYQAEEVPVGTGRAWWHTDYCALWCLLNTAAATVPPPSRVKGSIPPGPARCQPGLGTLQSLGLASGGPDPAAGLRHRVWGGEEADSSHQPLVPPDSGTRRAVLAFALIQGVCSFAAACAGEREELFALIVWIPASKITLCSDTQVTPRLSKITSG